MNGDMAILYQGARRMGKRHQREREVNRLLGQGWHPLALDEQSDGLVLVRGCGLDTPPSPVINPRIAEDG